MVPDWFPFNDGMVVKTTLFLPNKVLKQGGVLSNRIETWFSLHSRDLLDLFGPRYMISPDILRHFHQGWQQKKTIENMSKAQLDKDMKSTIARTLALKDKDVPMNLDV